jgi:hypothetical protein
MRYQLLHTDFASNAQIEPHEKAQSGCNHSKSAANLS